MLYFVVQNGGFGGCWGRKPMAKRDGLFWKNVNVGAAFALVICDNLTRDSCALLPEFALWEKPSLSYISYITIQWGSNVSRKIAIFSVFCVGQRV